jgi:hypothetical protein
VGFTYFFRNLLNQHVLLQFNYESYPANHSTASDYLRHGCFRMTQFSCPMNHSVDVLNG